MSEHHPSAPFFTTTKSLQLFQVMRQGAVILTSILLAKSGLSTGQIGVYESLLYLGTVLTFFWVNGLLQAMTPLYSRKDEVERKAFTFNVFAVFCGVSALLFCLLFFGKKLAVPLLTGLPALPGFEAFCIYLLFNLPAFPVEYFYLLKNKPWHIAAWGMASFGLHVVFLFVPLWLGHGLETGIWALAFLAAGRFCWTFLLVWRTGRPVFRKDLSLEYLRFAGPLMLASLAGNLIFLFDNWLVGWWYQNEATFAIYRYGARELPIVPALVMSLGVALVPRLTENLPEGLAVTKAMTRKLFHVLFPATIVLVFLAKPLFPLVFNPDFAASAPIFVIYLLIAASRVLLPNSILLALGQPKLIFRAGLVELGVKILLGFLFIRWWGLAGVAWSAVLSFWVEKIALIWVLEKKFGVKTGDWLDVKWYLGYVLALVLAFFAA